MEGLQNFSNGMTATPNADATPSQINFGLSSLQGQGFTPVTTLNAGTLGSVTPTTATTPITGGTAGASLGAAVTPATASSDLADAEAGRANAEGELSSLLGGAGAYSEAADTETQDQSSGLNADQSELDNVNNTISQTSLNYDQQIQQIQNGSTGATVGGVATQVNNINRQKTNDLAILDIRKSVLTDDTTRLQNTIDLKVKADTEANQNQIDNLKNQISSFDTDPETKAAMTAQANQQQATLDENKAAYTSALTNAAQNGAPASVLNAIGKAAQDPNATAASITAAAGQYAKDPKTAMDIAVAASTIAKNYADITNEQLDPSVLAAVKQGLNTVNGVPYYTSTTLDGVNATTKNALTKALITSGAKSVSPADSNTLDNITSATNIINGLSSSLDSLLPTSAAGQPSQYANTKWNDFLQTNPQLATFQSQWMTAVMPLIGAMKTGGGGGGGSARLFPTIETMFPSPTDTVAAAQTKIQAINNALISGSNAILGVKPVTINGQSYQVGQTVYNSQGKAGTVNQDGSITPK